jgi:hypothetical protein
LTVVRFDRRDCVGAVMRDRIHQVVVTAHRSNDLRLSGLLEDSLRAGVWPDSV